MHNWFAMALKKKATPDEYEVLRNNILRGELHPMQRLVEAELAERLNSNRARIRQALARLENDGLVAIERYRGAQVRMVSEEEAMEIFETRAVLEPYLVRQTAEKATRADKARLKALLRQLVDAFDRGDPMAVGRGSRKIRDEMWRIAGQKTIAHLLTALNTKLIRFWYRSVMVSERASGIKTNLEAVVDAICDSSAERAAVAMKRYHEEAIAALRQAMQLRSSGADPA